MNTFYRKGLQALMNKEIDLDTDDIRAILIDLNDYAKPITGATNATPIVMTVVGHGYANGDVIAQNYVGGNTAANGVWKIANVTADTYELVGSAGNGAYTSGGHAVNVTAHDFLNDVPAGARVAVSAQLTGVTITNGVFDCNDWTWAAVAGDVSEAVLWYRHTGNEATSQLIAIAMNLTGLPVTPVGTDISFTVAAAGLFALATP